MVSFELITAAVKKFIAETEHTFEELVAWGDAFRTTEAGKALTMFVKTELEARGVDAKEIADADTFVHDVAQAVAKTQVQISNGV